MNSIQVGRGYHCLSLTCELKAVGRGYHCLPITCKFKVVGRSCHCLPFTCKFKACLAGKGGSLPYTTSILGYLSSRISYSCPVKYTFVIYYWTGLGILSCAHLLKIAYFNERLWLIHSDHSGQMSDCEQIAQDKQAKGSDLFRFTFFVENCSFTLLLTKNEQFAEKFE